MNKMPDDMLQKMYKDQKAYLPINAFGSPKNSPYRNSPKSQDVEESNESKISGEKTGNLVTSDTRLQQKSIGKTKKPATDSKNHRSNSKKGLQQYHYYSKSVGLQQTIPQGTAMHLATAQPYDRKFSDQ